MCELDQVYLRIERHARRALMTNTASQMSANNTLVCIRLLRSQYTYSSASLSETESIEKFRCETDIAINSYTSQHHEPRRTGKSSEEVQ
jgi:hypothetical protein